MPRAMHGCLRAVKPCGEDSSRHRGGGGAARGQLGQKTGYSVLQLLTQVVEAALADARIEAAEVGALSFTAPARGTRQLCFSFYATARLGLRGVGKDWESGSGGWSVGLAFDAAEHELRAGRARFALALGLHLETNIETAVLMDDAIRATGDVGCHSPYGSTPLSWYAMDAQCWMQQHEVSRRELADLRRFSAAVSSVRRSNEADCIYHRWPRGPENTDTHRRRA